jgi:hypothetical protein
LSKPKFRACDPERLQIVLFWAAVLDSSLWLGWNDLREIAESMWQRVSKVATWWR